jgi:osmoprotectant transport system ATP-binding protein
VIVLENVSKSYASQRALSRTDLTVDADQCLALIGSSGSGKSTLLRLILGLIAPDTGSISIGGELMHPGSARRARLRIGYVIQDGGLFPHLTAVDNVTLVAKLVGWERREVQRRVETLTALVGLGPDLLHRYPAELSGGERQRVGLMRALMLDPPVLLLDEPLGSLDPVIRSKLQDDLHRIFRDLRKTVLLVTHDLDEAAFLGDEVALLHEGVLLQKGSLRDLVERPKVPFVAEFLKAQRPRTPRAFEAP